MNARTLLTFALALSLLAFSGCGARPITEQWSFSAASITGGVDNEGELLMDIGADFTLYGFSGRLTVGVDTYRGQMIFCFVADPYVDPIPVCYPVAIDAWVPDGSGDPSATYLVPAGTLPPLDVAEVRQRALQGEISWVPQEQVAHLLP